MDALFSLLNWAALFYVACFLAIGIAATAAWAWQVNEKDKRLDADWCELAIREAKVAHRERECDDMHDLLHGWQTSLVDAYGQKLLDEITGGGE